MGISAKWAWANEVAELPTLGEGEHDPGPRCDVVLGRRLAELTLGTGSDHEPIARVEGEHQEGAPAHQRLQLDPLERRHELLLAAVSWDHLGVEHVDRLELAAHDLALELAAGRLDLGKFGHRSTP